MSHNEWLAREFDGRKKTQSTPDHHQRQKNPPQKPSANRDNGFLVQLTSLTLTMNVEGITFKNKGRLPPRQELNTIVFLMVN